VLARGGARLDSAPDQLALPAALLDDPAAAADEELLVDDPPGAQQVAVGKQIRRDAGQVGARPVVHDAPTRIEEERRRRVDGREQRVAVEGGGLALQQADGPRHRGARALDDVAAQAAAGGRIGPRALAPAPAAEVDAVSASGVVRESGGPVAEAEGLELAPDPATVRFLRPERLYTSDPRALVLVPERRLVDQTEGEVVLLARRDRRQVTARRMGREVGGLPGDARGHGDRLVPVGRAVLVQPRRSLPACTRHQRREEDECQGSTGKGPACGRAHRRFGGCLGAGPPL
jgi:hypothetical protein